MILPAVMQWVAFFLFAFLALAGGLGMTTTMSMFRSGIFLMSSFIGVAGLFVLLSADLIGLLQIMMYIGGMLVMVLFMVLFMMDPGGAMMAGMKMSPVERLFSLGLKSKQGMDMGGDMGGMHMDGDSQDKHPGGMAGMESQRHDMGHGMSGHAGMHGKSDTNSDKSGDMSDMAMSGDSQGHESGGMSMDGDSEGDDSGSGGGKDMGDMQMDSMNGMDMGGMDMSMTTPARPYGIWLGGAVAALLVLALLLRPHWATAGAGALNPDAPRQVGELLMSRYMIGFEGAGLLILLGISGAVFIQRPGAHPSDPSRDSFVASEEPPTPIHVEHPLPEEAHEPKPKKSGSMDMGGM